MYRYFLFSLCILFCFPIVTEEWQFLGKSKENQNLGVDTIFVSQSEVFNKIQIRVMGQAIQLFDLNVHFHNGSIHKVSIQKNFSSGESSKIIDLPEKHFINYVKIKYRTTNFLFQKATLQLWGIKSSERHNQPSLNTKNNLPKKDKYTVNNQWKYIGSKNISDGRDYDIIDISKKESSFRSVRLQVTESSIFLKDYRIVFTNEEEIKETVGTLITENSYTNALDLSEHSRIIQKVILRYSSTSRRKAKVHLWGSQQIFYSSHPSSRRNRVSKRDRDRRSSKHSRDDKASKRKRDHQSSDHDRNYQFSKKDRDRAHQYFQRDSYSKHANNRSHRVSERERKREHKRELERKRLERELKRKHKQDSNSISSEVDQWEVIGKRKIDSRKNLGVIYPQGTKKSTSKIKIRVSGQDLEIKNLKIFFENGQFVDLSVGKLIPQGGSFTKDLPINIRKIDRIQFLYKSRINFFGSRQGAVVEAWSK